MRLQVFVDRERKFVSEVEPGEVAGYLGHILEMISDDVKVTCALDSASHPNVVYLIKAKRGTFCENI